MGESVHNAAAGFQTFVFLQNHNALVEGMMFQVLNQGIALIVNVHYNFLNLHGR